MIGGQESMTISEVAYLQNNHLQRIWVEFNDRDDPDCLTMLDLLTWIHTRRVGVTEHTYSSAELD